MGRRPKDKFNGVLGESEVREWVYNYDYEEVRVKIKGSGHWATVLPMNSTGGQKYIKKSMEDLIEKYKDGGDFDKYIQNNLTLGIKK